MGDATNQKVSSPTDEVPGQGEFKDAGSGLTGFISNLFGKAASTTA